MMCASVLLEVIDVDEVGLENEVPETAGTTYPVFVFDLLPEGLFLHPHIVVSFYPHPCSQRWGIVKVFCT